MTLLLLLLALPGRAQVEVRVIPTLDPTKILIGEQTRLSVKVVAPKDADVQLALPPDTLVTGVEILGVVPGDTTEISDRLRQIVYDVVLTSFDSASYTLDHVGAYVADRLVTAVDAPILMVNTVPVDLDHPDEIRDIKAQWQPPFVLWDYLVYAAILYAILSLIGLIFLIIAYIRTERRRRVAEEADLPTEPLRDPYDEAMEELARLREEKLWEHSQVKEYYTEMTDILRRYLRRVYGFDTGEMTSGEILELFRSRIGRERMYTDLQRILTTADLAKFAKYMPEAGENVALLTAARAFVEEHKPVTEPETKDGSDTVADEKRDGDDSVSDNDMKRYAP